MILNRLRVGAKLNLLVAIPLVVVVLLYVPLISERLSAASTSAATERTALTGRQLAILVEELQEARLLAVAHRASSSVDPNSLIVQLQLVRELASEVRPSGAQAGDLAEATAQVDELVRATEPRLLTRSLTAESIISRFGSLVDRLIAASALSRQVTDSAQDAWGLASLDSLLRSNEAASRGGALLLAATASTDDARRQALLDAAADYGVRADEAAIDFRRVATAPAAEVFDRATKSLASEQIAEVTAELAGEREADHAEHVGGHLTVEAFSAVQSQTGLRQLAQGEIAQTIVVATQAAARRAQVTVLAVTLTSALVMALVLALSVIVGRSVSGPLRRLTRAAGEVADLTEAELERVSDEDSTEDVTVRLAEIEVTTQDEIGELAQAYNRVQTTASRLLERQVVSRRNVAAMFSSIGRRTTNLVGRQLSLIDTLERREEDADTLATLYRLDHLSTRLRRNATSLVVLAGGSEVAGGGRAVTLVDAVRGSLGSVEDYARVQLDQVPDIAVAPGVLGDLLLLLAEVIENAVLFSPPSTAVRVTGELDAQGACRLAVIDLGLGMPSDRLIQENDRLRRRERLDLAPSHVLGLFVVGRIARRHGIDVQLEPNPDRGITVHITLPPSALVPSGALSSSGRRSADPRVSGGQRPARRAGTPGSSGPAASSSPPATPPPPALRPDHWPAERLPAPALPTSEGAVEAVNAAGAVDAAGTVDAAGAVDAAGVVEAAGPGGIRRRVPGAQLPQVDQLRPLPPTPARGLGLDPEAARRQVDDLERAIARASAPPPSDSHPDETRVRAGITRRVRGSALEALGLDASPQPAQRGGAHDPDAVRSSLDEVGAALDLAGHAHHVSPAEERRAAEAARAALREAAGRREEQREAVSALADQLLTGPLGQDLTGEGVARGIEAGGDGAESLGPEGLSDPPPSEQPSEQPSGSPPSDPRPSGGALPPRRVPGRALAEVEPDDGVGPGMTPGDPGGLP
ncbi:MAG: HAMP domain-containing protein [Kineosporiaceae bacterium]|nr:HAMP domain-containing protein [Kineosporiaceae bacterium]